MTSEHPPLEPAESRDVGSPAARATVRPAGAAPAGEPQQVRATPPRTRTSTAFSGFVAGAIVLILLLVFILENTQSVKISYFGASGHLALGVAPLLAAVGGALLGELDTDLLVFEHLRQGAAQLGGMVKQARSGLRLAGEAFEKPLRDLPGLPRHQAHMRDGRRAAEIGEVAGDQRDRATLNHAAEHHDIAADVLDRRRAPLPPGVAAHLKALQLDPHRSQSFRGERPGSQRREPRGASVAAYPRAALRPDNPAGRGASEPAPVRRRA